MKDDDRAYITILESEIETLRSKLEEAAVWKPWWKTFDKNPDRFDFMIGKCKIMTLIHNPRETAYGVWSAQSVLSYKVDTKAQTKEEAMAFVEKYVRENGYGHFVA